MTSKHSELDIFPPGEDPADLIPEDFPRYYRPLDVSKLPVDKYDLTTEKAIELVWKINAAIRENQSHPIIEDMPLSEYLVFKASKLVSNRYYTFFTGVDPLAFPKKEQREEGDVTWAEQAKIDNRTDGAGFTSGEATGRTPLRSARAKVASRAIAGGPFKKVKKKEPLSLPSKPLFGFDSTWTAENAARFREIMSPPLSTGEQLKELRLSKREDERLEANTGIRMPDNLSDTAKELMGMYDRQEDDNGPGILVEPWTRFEARNLKRVATSYEFYPKDRAELGFVLSHTDVHNRRISALEKIDNRMNAIVGPADKKKQKDIYLEEANKYAALLDDGIQGVRYSDDMDNRLKQLKKSGIEPNSKFGDLFPAAGIEHDMLLADQIARVASFHEADMIANGTPVTEGEGSETVVQYANRVLGDKGPQALGAIISAFSISEKNKFEYGLARLEEAQRNGAIREDVLAAREKAINQVFWGR